MISPASEAFMRQRRQTPAFGATTFDFDGLRKGMGSRRAPPPTLPVEFRPTDAGGVPGEWVLGPDADPGVRLLYLHGGGFVSGSGGFYATLAARLALTARCAVLLADYRLAPEHPFPAGLEDSVRAYEWLRDNGPAGRRRARATFIAGDSAGGGLTLGALLALRDRRRPLPRAAIALSPFTDMTLSGESLKSEGELDPIMHPRCLPDFVHMYLRDDQQGDPLASQVFADFSGLPPLQIIAGEHEIIRDDSVRVAERARLAGVPVDLQIWAGMFHVFPAQEPLLPEGRQAIHRMAAFLLAHAR